MFHLHRFHHSQRLAGLDLLAHRGKESDHLARHRRSQATGLGTTAIGRVGDRVELVDDRRAFGCEHAEALAGGVDAQRPAVFAECQVMAPVAA